MEILFSNILAWYEGILLILLLCVVIVIYIIDTFFFSRRLHSFFSGKRKHHAQTSSFRTKKVKDQDAREESTEEKDPSAEGEKIRQKEAVTNLISIIRTKIARGEIADAQAKIVEWLSLDKHNRELNLLLAEIYENIDDYRRAEILYKDLVPLYEHDEEIYQRLGDNLTKQEKYENAYEIYTELLPFTHERERVMYSLAFVSYHTGKMDDVLEYGKQFLHNHPYDPDILWIVAQAEFAREEYTEALEHLKKLRQLSPYNTEVIDQIDQIYARMERTETQEKEEVPETEPESEAPDTQESKV